MPQDSIHAAVQSRRRTGCPFGEGNVIAILAGMVELADTPDLGSGA